MGRICGSFKGSYVLKRTAKLLMVSQSWHAFSPGDRSCFWLRQETCCQGRCGICSVPISGGDNKPHRRSRKAVVTDGCRTYKNSAQSLFRSNKRVQASGKREREFQVEKMANINVPLISGGDNHKTKSFSLNSP